MKTEHERHVFIQGGESMDEMFQLNEVDSELLYFPLFPTQKTERGCAPPHTERSAVSEGAVEAATAEQCTKCQAC